MADSTGILLDSNLDLLIQGGTFVNGDATMSEVAVLLGLVQGQLKSDALLGPNLPRLMRSVEGRKKVATLAKLHLERDGKQYDEVKKLIHVNNGQG